ncbi:LPS-assembly protein LptD [Sulfitobacter aestuariivivens]|uniref:LPS-assembly protein LptD n=1 Tax=Sulfitobacter aestuariivivens TaxID=2766981 RepID=A0A927D5X0_9RHOB|nr:LPS assembly protein LptD [Sulfitobacter aestuariivivens]MBD3663391.1 LPS-assembly protein LptD [Sulfitobacter aestuariivivens]
MRLIWLICALLMVPLAVLAQDVPPRPAVLVADQVFITRDRTLVARGNVEAFQGETRLRAQAIRYNQQTGSLEIDGPIVLQDGDDQIILADAAQLDQGLRNGILTGARLVLNQQLQLAAQQINRVDGRYSQLYKTAITSCKVCANGKPPLWQIRARRVVHDQREQQLYFDEAQFRIRNVPVFYLPRLRLPDPTLKRATGFLTPSFRTTSQLGTGIKIPYFIKIGDHRDLTLTPYFSSATSTLELRYRQAFVHGRIEFNAAISDDDQRPGETRGYVFGYGTFDLQRDYKLYFAIEAVGDRSYLTEYGYSDRDRLRSELTVSRARRDKWVRGSLINFETLRDGEVNDNQPTLVLVGEYERRMFPETVGGELRFALQAHSHRRGSDVDSDADGDGVVDGRDVARINGQVEWLRRHTFASGLVADARAGINFDVFDITQDATVAQNHSDLSTEAAIALRYPMLRRTGSGVVQMLEPVVQLAFIGGNRLPIPNDESTRVEFDEGNLLALSRFPRPDRRERHGVAAVGLSWARFDPAGWDAHLTVGQVFRERADPAFTDSSGLGGKASDILLAGQIANAGGLSLTGRGLFDDQLKATKAELRGDWKFSRGRLGGSYVWLDSDPAEDRPQAISEFTLDGAYKINRQWTASADWRYDTADDRAATAGLGLTYNNECVSVDLSVRRRYSTSTSVEPSTNIGFNIGLRGFAASNGTERFERSCRN